MQTNTGISSSIEPCFPGFTPEEYQAICNSPCVVDLNPWRDPEQRRLAELGMEKAASRRKHCGARKRARDIHSHHWNYYRISCHGRFSVCCGPKKERQMHEKHTSTFRLAATDRETAQYYFSVSTSTEFHNDEVAGTCDEIRDVLQNLMRRTDISGALFKFHYDLKHGDVVARVYAIGRPHKEKDIARAFDATGDKTCTNVKRLYRESQFLSCLETLCSSEIPLNPTLRAEMEYVFDGIRTHDTIGNIPVDPSTPKSELDTGNTVGPHVHNSHGFQTHCPDCGAPAIQFSRELKPGESELDLEEDDWYDAHVSHEPPPS